MVHASVLECVYSEQEAHAVVSMCAQFKLACGYDGGKRKRRVGGAAVTTGNI